MVAEIKIDVNTIEVKKLIQKISRKQNIAIQRALNRVSNMAVLMITKRTQRGQKPDGGKFIPYAPATKIAYESIKENSDIVDLTLSGQMFRSLDFRVRGKKSTLLFANKDMEKRAFRHDILGVGKKKTKRPFFSIGKQEEPKLINEFSKFYFQQIGIR